MRPSRVFSSNYNHPTLTRRAQKYETYRGGGCSATSQKSHSDDELDSFNDPSVLDPELESKFKGGLLSIESDVKHYYIT